MHEEGVDRLVASHEHAERRLPVATGSSHLLPERRPRAGEAHADDGVEPADVDAQLERVGGGQAEQVARAEPVLQGPPFLGQVPAAVGGHPGGQLGGDLAEALLRASGDGLCPSPGPREDEGAGAVQHQVGEHVGRLAARGPPARRLRRVRGADQGRLPERDRARAVRRGVVGHGHHVEPGEPPRRRLRLAHRGRREHHDGLRPVVRAHAQQPAQHVRDVRTEHAPVVVALVHDDDPQSCEQPCPALVAGQERVVHRVRVGEHELRVVARPRPLVERAVAVDGGRPDERCAVLVAGQTAQLVGGERLRGRQVERGGGAVPTDRVARPTPDERVERRDLVGQRLPRGRARGHDDVSTRVHVRERLGLVRPEVGDALRREGRAHARVHPLRPGLHDGVAGGDLVQVQDPVGVARQHSVRFHGAIIPGPPSGARTTGRRGVRRG